MPMTTRPCGLRRAGNKTLLLSGVSFYHRYIRIIESVKQMQSFRGHWTPLINNTDPKYTYGQQSWPRVTTLRKG